MAWTAVHPQNTTTERVPDVEGAPTFTFGFWPPLEAERFHTIIRRNAGKQDDGAVGSEEFERAIANQHEHTNRMVAFGVRGWSGFLVDGVEVPCSTEEVEVDGVKVVRLTKTSLDFLYANKLRGELALKCYLFNTLSEDQKKTSGLRLNSASSTTLTDAPSAPPNGKDRLQAKSSGSAGSTSKAARTS